MSPANGGSIRSRGLLRAKVRGLRRQASSGRGLAAAILGLTVWIGLFAASQWFLAQVLAIEPIGVVMVRRLVSLVIGIMATILSLSSIINAFSTLLLAEDLSVIVASPIDGRTLHRARFIENAVVSAWMPISFSLAFFIPLGVVMSAPLAYYAAVVVVLFALVLLTSAIAFCFALGLASLVSAKRSRQVVLFLAVTALAVALVAFRNLEPERFFDPDQRSSLLEGLDVLTNQGAPWLPTTWASDALWNTISDFPTPGIPLVALAALAIASFFWSTWTMVALHRGAYSRSQHGSQLANTEPNRRRGRPLEQLIALRSSRSGDAALARELAAKDQRAFVRDPSQWSQALLLVALVAIYVVNFQYIKNIGDGGVLSRNALHFLNLALCNFVVTALCVRFVFPAISLEGKAFWIVRTAPFPISRFVWSKWRAITPPIGLLALLLVITTGIWLEQPPALICLAAVVSAFNAAGLTACSLGLGALFPRFELKSAPKIASGVGGVLFMLSGLISTVVGVIASAPATLSLAYWLSHAVSPSPTRWVVNVAGLLLACTATPLLGAWAIRRGIRNLDR